MRKAVATFLLALVLSAPAWPGNTRAEAQDFNSPVQESPQDFCRKSPNDLKCLSFLGSKSDLQSETGNVGGREARGGEDNSRFVIFLHTGGGDTSVGEEVSKRLQSEGFIVRGQDGDQDKVGGAGVDYFHPRDQSAAAVVASIVGDYLPKGSDPLMPRFQSVRNPPGYLGVWLFGRGEVASADDWTSRAPDRAWCFQEDRIKPGPGHYLALCLRTPAICDDARAQRKNRKRSPCLRVDGLRATNWNPGKGGLLGSWYKYSDRPFERPFPPLT